MSKSKNEIRRDNVKRDMEQLEVMEADLKQYEKKLSSPNLDASSRIYLENSITAMKKEINALIFFINWQSH